MIRSSASLLVTALLMIPAICAASPCSVLDQDCRPEACRTANPLCPESQVCLIALDNPPCDPISESCPHNGHCATITQTRCEGHEGCQGREVCYDKGRPLCDEGAPPEGPPCETPTSLPQGQCAPPTECAEDDHCRAGFACDRFRILLGTSRTEIGVCTPRHLPCTDQTMCPDEQWACLDGVCVPDDHDMVCDDRGCAILRRTPAMALSSPQAAPAPMKMRPPSRTVIPADKGCQSGSGSPPAGGWWLIPALIALAATRRCR